MASIVYSKERGYMKRLDSGQIVLLLVLITVVGLTIGLSLISRTITDVRISSQIEQSGRAFSAADAGIETALKGISEDQAPAGTVTLDGATATYTVEDQGGTSDMLEFSFTEVGQTQTVWLLPRMPDGQLDESAPGYPITAPFDVCWGAQDGVYGAVVLSVFYKHNTVDKIAKAAYDGIAGRGNNLPLADMVGGYCTGAYPLKKTLVLSTDFSLPSGSLPMVLRIVPVYESTPIAILATQSVPLQGKLVTSIGKTDTGIVRKIQVYQGFPALPNLFDFTLFVAN